MNNSRTINTPQSADLVSFSILIEGNELSAVHQVMNITVENELNRIPFAQIAFYDGSAADQDFKLSNEDLLIPGKEIEIKAGYHNDVETIFKGIIIKHSIKIRENNSLLLVECRDKAVTLTIGRKSAYYYDSTDSAILEGLLGNYGLTASVETTTPTHPEMVQYRSSDWDFMLTRAQANGLVCNVEDGIVTLQKPDLEQESIETIAFGATLLSFDAEMDARNQFNKISTYGWNPSDQEVVEVEAADPNYDLNGNITAKSLAKTIGLENLELKHGGISNSDVLQQWGDAKASFQQLAKTRGRLKFQGIASVKPNTKLTLEGVGDRFNGEIYISAVKHQIVDGNWTVDAQFGLNPTWFSETFDVSENPASGLLPAIQGLQLGVVTQLEEDPDGEERILVRLPIINNEEQGVWARVASTDAGDTRGVFFRPEIGDEVLVGFINDDPNHACILGCLHSSNKPAPWQASDDNYEKGIMTRSGMQLLFNDDTNTITLNTPKGNTIVLDEDSGSIKVEDENGNIITLDSDGVSLESAKDINLKATGDVNIEGVNINLKASAQFLAEGGAGAEVSTSAIAVVKGSMVQIN